MGIRVEKKRERRIRLTLTVAARRRADHLRRIHQGDVGAVDCVCELSNTYFAKRSAYGCGCRKARKGRPRVAAGMCCIVGYARDILVRTGNSFHPAGTKSGWRRAVVCHSGRAGDRPGIAYPLYIGSHLPTAAGAVFVGSDILADILSDCAGLNSSFFRLVNPGIPAKDTACSVSAPV